MTDYIEYFDRFFEEKDLEPQGWAIPDPLDETVTHIIDSDYVIDAIKIAPSKEQKAVRDMLVRLDFANQPIMPYLKHLAECMIKVRSDRVGEKR